MIYFTDPTFGRQERFGILREPELDFTGVFRLHPDSGELTLLAGDFERPNGLCFSLDEKQLFVNDTRRGHIRAFDVKDDGTLSGGDVWAELTGDLEGVPDGMKMDSAGTCASQKLDPVLFKNSNELKSSILQITIKPFP